MEITVCYDVYLENAYQKKVRRHKEVCNYLDRNGFSVQLVVLCLGSLRYVESDAWKELRNFSRGKVKL